MKKIFAILLLWLTASCGIRAQQGGTNQTIPPPTPPVGIPSNLQSGMVAEYRIVAGSELSDSSGAGNNLTLPGGTANPSFIGGATGGISCSAASSQFANLPVPLNSAQSFIVYASYQTSGNSFNALIMGNGGGSVGNTIGMILGISASQDIQPRGIGRAQLFAGAGAPAFQTQTYGTLAGTGTVGWTIPPATDHIFLNGQEVTAYYNNNQGPSNGFMTTGNYQLCGAAAGKGAASATFFTGNIYWVDIWNRQLSQAEMLQAHNRIVENMNLRGIATSTKSSQTGPIFAFPGDSITSSFAAGGLAPFTTLNEASDPPVTASSCTHASNIVTCTITSTAQMFVGEPIIVSGATGDTSINTSNFSPPYIFISSIPSATTFTYPVPTVSGTPGGTITITPNWWNVARSLSPRGVINNAVTAVTACADQADGNINDDPLLPTTQTGPSVIVLWAGTNDINIAGQFNPQGPVVAENCLATWARQRRQAGWQHIGIVPMISRGLTNACELDTRKNDLDAVILQNWRDWGYDFIVTVDSTTMLANGACSGFQDSIHPGSTDIAKEGAIFARDINRVLGIKDYQTALANTYTASFTQRDADQFMVVTGTTAAQTGTLETCSGWGGQNITFKNSSTQSWTVAAAGAETIDGAASVTVAAKATLILQDQITSLSAGGCQWRQLQNN